LTDFFQAQPDLASMLLALPPAESEVLERVTVRQLAAHERPAFDRLLREEHYLHSSVLVGQSLCYVAEVAGQWLALLTFSAPALHLKARERWLGWTPRQRARRLGLVVNNSRFLLLPERQRYPNLASRVLALCLRRLSADWEVRWGHPVLVVEREHLQNLDVSWGHEPGSPTAVRATAQRDRTVL
jgi:hypothetical protein